jgi:hypothetical protein
MRRTSTPEFRAPGSLERATDARCQQKKIGGNRSHASGRSTGVEHSPGHGAIGLDAVLEAVELPAGVADLDPGLADVDADDLSHPARPSALPPSSRAAVSLCLGRALPLISPSLSSFQNV